MALGLSSALWAFPGALGLLGPAWCLPRLGQPTLKGDREESQVLPQPVAKTILKGVIWGLGERERKAPPEGHISPSTAPAGPMQCLAPMDRPARGAMCPPCMATCVVLAASPLADLPGLHPRTRLRSGIPSSIQLGLCHAAPEGAAEGAMSPDAPQHYRPRFLQPSSLSLVTYCHNCLQEHKRAARWVGFKKIRRKKGHERELTEACIEVYVCVYKFVRD